MRVYNLTTKEHALSDIENERLKISRLDELNDPFELIGLALKNKAARRRFANFKRQMNDNYGLLCFSKRWHNPVLWGHYGDKHRGICLGFDVPSRYLKKIDYSAERLNIALNESDAGVELNEKLIQKLLFTKYEHWAYEEEYRVYTRLKEPDAISNLYFKDFGNDLALKKVIVGPMCDATYDDIINILGVSVSTKVVIIKARLAFNTYKVVKNRNPGNAWRRNA